MNERRRALFLIKHEAVQRGLVGEIISRIEKKGLKIIGMKMFEMSCDDVRSLYSNCIHLPFFEEMLRYNSCCPVIGIVVDGVNGNKCANEVCGKIGQSGTVRGDLALSHARNLLHCSDDEATDREINLFFKESELSSYKLINEEWMI